MTAMPSFGARLERWAADARIEAHADERSRERWLEQAASGDATFAGVLIDLAERGQRGHLQLATGRRLVGTVDGLGADFVALRLVPEGHALVPIAAVDHVAGLVDPTGGAERAIATDLRLADVLGELAAERERVQLLARDPSVAVVGVLRGAGRDVVTVRTDADPPTTVSVRIEALSEVRLA